MEKFNSILGLLQEGGFYSAQDADSLPSHNAKAKREGAFYVWTEQEIDDALKDVTVNGDSSVDVATYFKQYFGVKANGNCPSDTVRFPVLLPLLV